MNSALSDYDRRQLGHMQERLFLYEQGTLNLAALIADLDFLTDALQTVDADWRDAVRREWSILEEVYADALDTAAAELGRSR